MSSFKTTHYHGKHFDFLKRYNCVVHTFLACYDSRHFLLFHENEGITMEKKTTTARNEKTMPKSNTEKE